VTMLTAIDTTLTVNHMADLGTGRALLSMDFLKAYDAEISLKHDTVSFRASTVINAVIEEGPDHLPVCLGQDCATLTGHLNRCLVQVEGGALRGTFLFEPTNALSNALPDGGAGGECE